MHMSNTTLYMYRHLFLLEYSFSSPFYLFLSFIFYYSCFFFLVYKCFLVTCMYQSFWNSQVISCYCCLVLYSLLPIMLPLKKAGIWQLKLLPQNCGPARPVVEWHGALHVTMHVLHVIPVHVHHECKCYCTRMYSVCSVTDHNCWLSSGKIFRIAY